MVFISTWKRDRFVAKTFLMGPILRYRAFADYCWNRAWNGSLQWAVPGDVRFYVTFVPFMYLCHRWHNDHNLDGDSYEKTLLKRWGDDVEMVRKSLSPADQVRALNFAYIERYYSVFGPKTIAPTGCPLPGKDFYQKDGHSAHH
jgi:hypothetical protein